MNNVAIKVENLSKAYQLGDFSTGTLNQDIERWWATIRGKEDPFLKVGEENEQTSRGVSDIVWSLKDIDFEINQGDAVGIIGRNGAGKSTLLKILSRVTSPTTGSVKLKGRVASLLEVGTGFHPELNGRENIFLNGSILGMRKAEIKKHFDAIVDFAGVERYIDTPVKRYSSGMYVRLAFAVAAHLEAEILIVDEVLAVGDAEFQKKCLGKMNEVSKGEGRTILFVSHSMAAVKQLCSKAILLKNGKLCNNGKTADVINDYISNSSFTPVTSVRIPQREGVELCFTSISVISENEHNLTIIRNNDDFYIKTTFIVTEELYDAEISLCFKNPSGVSVFFTSLSDAYSGSLLNLKKGNYTTKTKIRNNFLLPNSYTVDLYAHYRNKKIIDSHMDVIKLSMIDLDSYMAPYGSAATDFSCVLEVCDWSLTN